MKKSYIVLGVILIGVIVTFLFVRDDKELVRSDYKVVNNYFENQMNIDSLIKEYSSSDSYTFENPKIIVNPYNTINNSSLIIFSTREDTKIKVIVNGKEIGVTNNSKSHIIPIMNLKSEYDNVVKLVTDEKTSNEFNIKIDSKNMIVNDFKLLGSVDNTYLLVNDKYNNKYKMDYLGRIIEYYGLNTDVKYGDKLLNKTIYSAIDFIDIKNSSSGFIYDEIVSTSDIKDKLENAGLSKDYNIDNLNIVLNYKGKDIKILLIKDDKTYILPYDDNCYLGYLDDKYELYAIIDGTYYNLNLMIY